MNQKKNNMIVRNLLLFTFALYCPVLIGQVDSLHNKTLYRDWELIASVLYKPEKDTNLYSSDSWTTKYQISEFNAFKLTHGWKKELLMISQDGNIKDCTFGKRKKVIQCFTNKFILNDKTLTLDDGENNEILYLSNEILVLYSEYFFNFYTLNKKALKKLPSNFIIKTIEKKFHSK